MNADPPPPSPARSSKVGLLVAAMAGIGLGTALVLYYGLAEVGDAFLTAGWRGIVAIAVVHVVPLVLCAWAWRVLAVDGGPDNAGWLFLWARWVRDGVGDLLAIVPGAGEMAGARELTQRGFSFSVAAATTVADITTEMLSQLLFTLIGLTLLVVAYPNEKSAWTAAVGLAIATVAVVGFLIAQRKGLVGFLETLPSRLGLTKPWDDMAGRESVHAAVQSIYAYNGRVIASTLLHLGAWLSGVAEAWLALWFMGHPISVADAVALESLVFALRTAAFLVPWAAGIQEGGYVFVGAIFGLGPDAALALSLLKRSRELATGVPGIIAWQWVEGRRLWRRRSGIQPARANSDRPAR